MLSVFIYLQRSYTLTTQIQHHLNCLKMTKVKVFAISRVRKSFSTLCLEELVICYNELKKFSQVILVPPQTFQHEQAHNC